MRKLSLTRSKKSDLTDTDKQAASNYIEGLTKRFGAGSGFLLTDEAHHVDVIPSGLPSLDWTALRCGGIPKGRIIEIIGPESSGKTTLALQFVAQAQKQQPERFAHFIDAEHALDPEYAQNMGIDSERFFVSQPSHGEEALEIVSYAATSKAVSIIVIDSVAALVPKAELDGEMGEHHMGLHARLMSQAMRKLSGIVHDSNAAVIFINQIRMKIGLVFGNPETTTGGNALKFYASVRMETRKKESLKKDDIVFGQEMQVKVVKNKVAPPFGVAIVDLIYGQGFDENKSLLSMAVERKLVEKNGIWYSYNNERLGQGETNAANALAQLPEVQAELRRRIYNADT